MERREELHRHGCSIAKQTILTTHPSGLQTRVSVELANFDALCVHSECKSPKRMFEGTPFARRVGVGMLGGVSAHATPVLGRRSDAVNEGRLSQQCTPVMRRREVLDSPGGSPLMTRRVEEEGCEVDNSVISGWLKFRDNKRPSTPHPGFDEVFEAYNESPICPQKSESETSLDCLSLNLYIPNKATSNNRLPVLVWIYGGGYNMGSNKRDMFGPGFLVRHDIIIVAINYRLGPYGFMCLNNPKVPGNQGLKDQHLALKWIKNNIAAFGGDENSITISGESAGGASVDFHLYYQEDKLFDKAILQSGNTLTAPGIVREPDTEAPLKLAKFLGYETDDENEALSFLSTVDTKLVFAATEDLGLILNVPCVEKSFDGVDAFMKNYPINTLLPNIKSTPILIGFNNRECKEEYNKEKLVRDNLIRYYLDDYFNFETSELDEMEELIKHYYIGDQIVSEDTASQIIDFMSDFKFNYGTVRSIMKYLENGAEKVYYYVFSYEGGRSFGGVTNSNQSGAAHGDDLVYLFESTDLKDEPTPEDQTVIDRMTTLWSNFVKYGNPTLETSDLLSVSWPTVSRDNLYYLDIDGDISIKQRALHARITFWELFYKLNEKYEQGYQNDDQQNK